MTGPSDAPNAGMRQSFEIEGGAVERGHSLYAHPADGTTAHVNCGDGAWMTIFDPSADTSLEWSMRYGDPEQVRFAVASVLSSYNYLLSGSTTKEAQRRIALLRRAAARLVKEGPMPPRKACGEQP